MSNQKTAEEYKKVITNCYNFIHANKLKIKDIETDRDVLEKEIAELQNGIHDRIKCINDYKQSNSNYLTTMNTTIDKYIHEYCRFKKGEIVLYNNNPSRVVMNGFDKDILEIYYTIEPIKGAAHAVKIRDDDADLSKFGRFNIGDVVSYCGVTATVFSVGLLNLSPLNNKPIKLYNINYNIKPYSTNKEDRIVNVRDDSPLLTSHHNDVSKDKGDWKRNAFTSCTPREKVKKQDETFKLLLISFLTAKDTVIYNHTDIHIICKEDLDDVYTWSEDFCKFFLTFPYGTESYHKICPWCLIYLEGYRPYDNQDACTYGLRHGFCADSCGMKHGFCVDSSADSPLYGKIVKSLGLRRSISHLHDIQSLISTYGWVGNI